jgi:hypothetical protein
MATTTIQAKMEFALHVCFSCQVALRAVENAYMACQ